MTDQARETAHEIQWQRTHHEGCGKAFVGLECDCPPAVAWVRFDDVVSTLRTGVPVSGSYFSGRDDAEATNLSLSTAALFLEGEFGA
jgi:hypothetical protein